MTPDDDRSGPDEADRVVRVIDASGGIAGPYCAKVLADAGAEVFKVGAGDVRDPWSIRSSGLRDHLDLAKRPINGELAHAATGADIVVAGLDCDVVGLRAAHPSLVVVTVTPFGTDGPWRDRAASEFTLQAAVGSTGQRGLPEDVPLAAGGRLGEWITGTYAAVAGLVVLFFTGYKRRRAVSR